jgi:hypothetical protein
MKFPGEKSSALGRVTKGGMADYIERNTASIVRLERLGSLTEAELATNKNGGCKPRLGSGRRT